MGQLRWKYGLDRWIELDLVDYLYFTGGNFKMARRLLQSLERFKTGKALNEIEENIYGEMGIEVYYNDKLLKPRNLLIITVKDILSLISEFHLTRKNLIYDELLQLQQDLEVDKQMEQINNEIILLETMIQEKMKYLGSYIGYEFNDMQFETLLKSHLSLTYYEEENQIPLEYMAAENILSSFIELINSYISRTGKMVWVIFDRPFDFLDEKNIEFIFEELSTISRQTHLLHFFVFNNHSLHYNLSIDTEKIVLLYDEYQQLPELDLLRRSIERNYPENYDSSDKELLSSVLRVCHLIGRDITNNYSLDQKDMVLLKILKNLLGDNSLTETSEQTLSAIERAYLLNQG